MGAFNMGRGPVGLAHDNARAAVGFANAFRHPLGALSSPACGGGTGRGHTTRFVLPTPSPTLPRKRERERTEIAGMSGANYIAGTSGRNFVTTAIDYVTCLC